MNNFYFKILSSFWGSLHFWLVPGFWFWGDIRVKASCRAARPLAAGGWAWDFGIHLSLPHSVGRGHPATPNLHLTTLYKFIPFFGLRQKFHVSLRANHIRPLQRFFDFHHTKTRTASGSSSAVRVLLTPNSSSPSSFPSYAGRPARGGRTACGGRSSA